MFIAVFRHILLTWLGNSVLTRACTVTVGFSITRCPNNWALNCVTKIRATDQERSWCVRRIAETLGRGLSKEIQNPAFRRTKAAVVTHPAIRLHFEKKTHYSNRGETHPIVVSSFLLEIEHVEDSALHFV